MNRLKWRILGLYYFKSQFFMMYGVIHTTISFKSSFQDFRRKFPIF